MPRVFFSITSISEAHFQILSRGYHNQDEPKKNFISRAIRKLSQFSRKNKNQEPRPMSFVSTDTSRSTYPVLDPQFLLFAMSIAGYLKKGFIVGHIDRTSFTAYNEISLGTVSSGVIIACGKFIVHRTAHKYMADVNDVPELGRLKKLLAMTSDPSLSELLNRISLWLYLFVEIHHYGWSVAVKHPAEEEIKILTSPFFAKFSNTTAL